MAGQLDAQKFLEQLEQLPRQARQLVMVGVCAAVVLIYYLAVYGGVQQELDVARQQLAKVQGEIAEAQAVVANLETFRARSEELSRKYEAARERLPSATELPVLLTDVSSLGKKAGLEFRAFKPETEIPQGFYVEVPIRVEFLGTYHQVGVFFDRLSKLSRIVNMKEFTMKISKQDLNGPVLLVKGIASTFRFVEQKEEGA